VLCIATKFWAWDNTISLDDENTTTQLEPRYQLQSNTQSFESISLNSRSSQRYHQAFTAPPSSSTTLTRNSGSTYTTSMVHQNPFGGVKKWGTFVAAPAFTPSQYILLQTVTSIAIYTIEISSLMHSQPPEKSQM